jgi:hypothetical protein
VLVLALIIYLEALIMENFEDLDFEITEETHPSSIYEQTKKNPHGVLTANCNIYTGSLDEYAKELCKKMFPKQG